MGGHTRIAQGTYPRSILRSLPTWSCHTGTRAVLTFMACLKIERVVYNDQCCVHQMTSWWKVVFSWKSDKRTEQREIGAVSLFSLCHSYSVYSGSHSYSVYSIIQFVTRIAHTLHNVQYIYTGGSYYTRWGPPPLKIRQNSLVFL